MFRVGQKVVCVSADPSDVVNFGIRVGGIYTVSGMGIFEKGQPPLMDLAEIKTHVAHAWLPDRFRPLVEHKTDISVFTSLLTPTKQTEHA